MEIDSSKEDDATVVTLRGRMDAITSPLCEKRLNDLVAKGETKFVIDLEGLNYISSAGLRVILAIAKTLRPKGGQICFANVQATVWEVFDISGFRSLFQMYDSLASARSGLKG